MLPNLHRQAYQKLLTALQQMQQETTASNLDLAALQTSFSSLQQIFQQQILTLTTENIPPTLTSRWQSLQTEINRALRLLQTDIMFLRSSRQTTTYQQRLISIDKRLEQMIGYCQILLSQQ